MSILTVGTVAFDSIETDAGSVDSVLGGSATYITLAARFFCEDVRLVAVVGSDFPERFVDILRDRQVDLDGLQVDPDGKTFAWSGRYHPDMIDRDTLYTHLNVLETFQPEIPEAYRDSRLVCLGNLDPTIQREVLEQVDDPELIVCDTMNFWIEHTLDSLKTTLGRVHCLLVNDEEARQLSGESNLLKAAQVILDQGPRILIIKKGEHGAMVLSRDSIFVVPAFPIEHIQDPTGAGDTFMGGFIGYLSRYETFSEDALRRAVVYGSTLASFCVERFGTDRLLTLSHEDIEKRVDSFRRITLIPEEKDIEILLST